MVDGQSAVPILSAGADQKEGRPPIVRKEGDENSSAFWNLFANAQDQDRAVDKATAISVAKTIV
jgi:hypothetical protein